MKFKLGDYVKHKDLAQKGIIIAIDEEDIPEAPYLVKFKGHKGHNGGFRHFRYSLPGYEKGDPENESWWGNDEILEHFPTSIDYIKDLNND